MNKNLYSTLKLSAIGTLALGGLLLGSATVKADSTSQSQGSDREATLQTMSNNHATGYLYVPSISNDNGGYAWFENGQLFTGFRYYAGTYYWFENGIRQNNSWHNAWGYTYYTDQDGRAVQGTRVIDGKIYDFGNDNTYYERPVQGYVWDGSPDNGGYRWYEDGQLYTGFRYYMGTYYWFVNGVRQNAGWRQAWGYTYYTDQDGRAVQGIQSIDGKNYYFGDDGSYYLRGETAYRQTVTPNVNTYGGPGLCLQYVDDAFNINSNRSYSAKIAADKASGNGTMHYDNQFPVGVKVPVYWNLVSKDDGVNYGHIAIWDGQGGFYWEGNNSSTPNYFTLDEMRQVLNGTRPVNGHYLTEDWQTPSLIGWSTSLEGHTIASHN